MDSTASNSPGETVEVVDTSPPVALKRRVGLPTAFSVLVGGMIGSGIFVSPKGVAVATGSVGMSMILWTVGGLISLIGAMCYVELGQLIPKAGGEYIYFLKAFGAPWAFLFAWAQGMFRAPSSLAIVSLTAAQYILVPFYDDDCRAPPETHTQLLAMAILLFLAAVNIYSVTLTARLVVIFTVAKVLALTMIIIGGFVMLGKGHTEHIETGFDGSDYSMVAILTGIYSVMFSYGGWNGLNTVVEEVVNPKRVVVRAIPMSLVTVTLIYVLANVSYFTAMSVDDLIASPAVAVTWAQRVIPGFVWIIPVSVAMSCFGGCSGAMFITPRLFFSAAREKHMLTILSMIGVRSFSPTPSIILLTLLAIVYVYIGGGIQNLLDSLMFTEWIFGGMTAVAVFVLRRKIKDEERPFKVSLIFPILYLAICLVLLIFPIAMEPKIGYIYALLLILAGFILYFPFIFFKLEVPGMGRLNLFLQQIMQVSPTDEFEKEM